MTPVLRPFLCSFVFKGVWIGYTFTGFLVAAGARPGGVYHIGQSSNFSVLALGAEPRARQSTSGPKSQDQND